MPGACSRLTMASARRQCGATQARQSRMGDVWVRVVMLHGEGCAFCAVRVQRGCSAGVRLRAHPSPRTRAGTRAAASRLAVSARSAEPQRSCACARRFLPANAPTPSLSRTPRRRHSREGGNPGRPKEKRRNAALPEAPDPRLRGDDEAPSAAATDGPLSAPPASRLRSPRAPARSPRPGRSRGGGTRPAPGPRSPARTPPAGRRWSADR